MFPISHFLSNYAIVKSEACLEKIVRLMFVKVATILKNTHYCTYPQSLQGATSDEDLQDPRRRQLSWYGLSVVNLVVFPLVCGR